MSSERVNTHTHTHTEKESKISRTQRREERKSSLSLTHSWKETVKPLFSVEREREREREREGGVKAYFLSQTIRKEETAKTSPALRETETDRQRQTDKVKASLFPALREDGKHFCHFSMQRDRQRERERERERLPFCPQYKALSSSKYAQSPRD